MVPPPTKTGRVALRLLLVLSLLAAQLTWMSPLASASTLNTALSVLFDGTAPFEDWQPSDTLASGPTSDGIHQPGDDLAANNGIVRTLDTVMYQAEYSVNPPFPSNTLTLTFTVANARVSDAWNPPPSMCPGGMSFAIDRTAWTCVLGAISGASGTVAIQVPVVAPQNTPNGSTISAALNLTESGGSTSNATAAAIQTSSAPKFDLFKIQNSPGHWGDLAYAPGASSGPAGFIKSYVVGLRTPDLDPRGNSALPGSSLSITDVFTPGGTQLSSCYSSVVSTLPSVYGPGSAIDPSNTIRLGTTNCTQAGPGAPIAVELNDIDWSRAAAPPTRSNQNASLPTDLLGIIAMATVTIWIPALDVDMTDGANDNIGEMQFANAIDLSDGAAATAGACSPASNWSLPSGGSTFDPVDIGGLSNLGTGTEPVANNGTCHYVTIAPSRYHFKSQPETWGSSVVPNQTFTSDLALSNSGSVVPLPSNGRMCDKFDNSRFTLTAPPVTSTRLVGPNYSTVSHTIEYGISDRWGSHSSASPQERYFDQASGTCNDGDVTDLGGGVRWATGAQVDWTNSGAGLVNVADVNVVRITTSAPIDPLKSFAMEFTWRALPRPGLLTWEDRQLRNYGAFNDGSYWTVSSCPGIDYALETCEAPMPLGVQAGSAAAWWTLTDGVARVFKELENAAVHLSGETVRWRLLVEAHRADTVPSTGPVTGGNVHDVEIVDILPAGLAYVPGSVTISAGMIGEPTVIPNTPSPGLTTLRWNLGDMAWESHVYVRFDTTTSIFLSSGSYTNTAIVNTPDDQRPHFVSAGVGGDMFRSSSASVTLVGASQAVIAKTTPTPSIAPGDTAVFELQFGNPATDPVETMDAVDILPFNGDGRGTIITPGTVTFSDATTSYPNTELWVSSTDPSILDASDGTTDDRLDPTVPGVGVGTPTWPCTVADAIAGTGGPGCPALNAVTAIRVIGLDPDPLGSGAGSSFLPSGSGPHTVEVTLDTSTSALPGDTFNNSWLATFEGLSLPVYYAAAVNPHVVPLGVGDLVFRDVENNGIFDGPDSGISGVAVEIYRSTDTPGVSTPVGTTTTDAQGRWFVGDLATGDYVAYLPPSNFLSGNPLDGFVPTTTGIGADTGTDDTADHNATTGTPSTGISTGTFHLSIGTEPTGENHNSTTITGHLDGDTDLTIDFAMFQAPEIQISNGAIAGGTANLPACASQDPARVLTGGTVTYCFEISNPGPTHLSNVTFSDSALGIDWSDVVITSGNPTLLAPGATIQFYYTTTATVGLTNTASTSGTPSRADGSPYIGMPDPSASDPSTVEVYAPAMTITNTVNHGTTTACPGTETANGATNDHFTYCFTITNTGDTDLDNITINNPELAITNWTDVTITNTWTPGTPLTPGNTITFTINRTEPTDLTNNLNVTSTPTITGTPLGTPDLTATDPSTIDVFAPAMTITNTVNHGTTTACPGTETANGATNDHFTYCFTITNTGDTDLDNITINNPELAITNWTDVTITNTWTPGTPLTPGNTITFTINRTEPTDLTNNLNVTSTPTITGTPLGTPDLTATDPSTIDVDALLPAVQLTKTVDQPLVFAGTTVTFTITVTNIGPTELVDLQVSDPTTPACETQIDSLLPGAQHQYSCTAVIDAPTVNIATVTGHTPTGNCDAAPIECVTDTDQAEIETTEPTIAFEKIAITPEVDENAKATFRFMIRNDSAITITDIVVDDITFPICSRNIERIEPGKTVEYDCEVTAPKFSFENYAEVKAAGASQSTTVTASSASVTVRASALGFTGTSLSLLMTVSGFLMALGSGLALIRNRRTYG